MEELDLTEDLPMKVVKVEKKTKKNTPKVEYEDPEELVSCLKNERVVVRFIPRQTALVTNPKHVLYGGMAETATRTFVVPKLTSGIFVNVLTKQEKDYLEHLMGLEPNALSIYKKEDNFWDDSVDGNISEVKLTKQDTYLDLSNPRDYIKYKILLANKDYIAPSLQALEDRPKQSYQFVLINEGDETKKAKEGLTTMQACYKEFGKIEDDAAILKTIIELIDGRPVATNSKLDFLQTKVNAIIQGNSKQFLKVVTDPMLRTKSLIKECIEAGIISKRGDYLYVRSDNSPLCENGEEPTLNVAAKYLNKPKHQDLKFALEAKLKQ